MNKLWFYILLIMVAFSSCVSEVVMKDTPESNDGSYLSVQSYGLRSGGTYAGDMDDFVVQAFRILAFNGSGQCISNVSYNGNFNEIIVHPIDIGTYDFIFLANEPDNAGVKNQLDNITIYSDLDDIAYPASSFSSDTLIPMMQEIKNVEILKGGVSKTNGILNPSPIQLALDRLGARLDVTLKAEEDLDATFTGITLSNIPDRVPLTSNYTGTINRNQTRSFTVTGNSEYFSDTTIIESGIVWAKNIKRIIIPSNVFTPESDKGKAVVFTINMEGKYNPSGELKIGSNDYTLPINSKLNLLAKVRMPLELNITASEWEKFDSNWNTNYRTLNVSQVSADITDFNGVRISFWSNMPKVRILPDVYVGTSGSATEPTNKVFNDLAVTGNSNSTTRFSYNPATGSGYMDILIDTINAIGTYTFRLILSAEEADGTNALQREITVNVTQNGERPIFDKYGNGFIGAFFRNDETGERIISGQHTNGLRWEANVESGFDFIMLSSTPSFDPEIGTDNPGDAELYPVKVNEQKGAIENEQHVEGTGRIYFRVGTKSVNNTGQNRYGTIKVRFELYGNDGTTWHDEFVLYIRQGEDADYIWRPDEADRIVGGSINNKLRTGARKFSPYNLTAQTFKDGGSQSSVQLAVNGAVTVDYPTQGGAYFQWGIKENETNYNQYVRRAYHPITDIDPADWTQSFFNPSPIWNPSTGYAYKTDNELCPPGYSRPSDGYTDRKAFNGPYAQFPGSPDLPDDYSDEIEYSALRVSLMKAPLAGNGYADGVDPTFQPQQRLDGTSGGFYSDGFFDRRPVINIATLKAVSINNANIAFGGVLYFNENTKASLFLPSAGRRNTSSILQWQGTTGFYWSSSTSPWYPNLDFGVWGFESAYYHLQPVSSLGSFGHSIRCVKD